MGTVPYMAPEQIEGKPADARTDMFAFGWCFTAALRAARLPGDSEASIVSAIMTSEPPLLLATLQPLTPPSLERLVHGCLAKDPDARRESARDLADDLRSIRAAAGVSSPDSALGRPRRRWMTALIVLGVLGAAVAGAASMWWLSRRAPRGPVVRLDLNIRPAEEVNSGGVFAWTAGGSTTALTWTPDGRALVFVGRRGAVQQIYIRPLDAR